MLTENDVVEALCGHLSSEGYSILQRCSTKERGIDIVAKHPKQKGRLLIEAKGETSSLDGTARFGKAFTTNQVFDRVAKGFYTGVCLRNESWNSADQVALAFPKTPKFEKQLAPLEAALKSLGILVYLVAEDGSVTNG